MTNPVRLALPVPPVGTALDGSGEAYVASLVISIECDETNASIGTTGDVLEALLVAVGMRSKAFHPRTFAFSPFEVDASTFAALLDRKWSSIDSSGPEVVDLANTLVVFGKRARTVSFRQVN